MARIKEYDRGSGRKRKRKPVVYIICEGSETEPRYFRAFRTRYCNIDIIPLSYLPSGCEAGFFMPAFSRFHQEG